MTNNILQAIVERIEKLEDERSLLAADIKEIFLEAAHGGFDPKIIRKIIALRKKKTEEREQERQILDRYMVALGMLTDTPLGQYAIKNMKED
jgi:uncharacterized protein (UPF0335 family)